MSNTVTSAFIDIATFDEIEKYLYNGPTAITYFVRCVKKATWFAQVPVTLTKVGSTADFNQETCWSISRAGDYLTYVWLRATLPAVTVSSAGVSAGARWCWNVGHNLIDNCKISFNDLTVQEFDSYWLDMNAAFTVPASKRIGYNNMIGTVNVLYTSALDLPAYTLNVPLPFFFTRDTGIALPTAALPYNEMKIDISFRDWRDLLILEPNTVIEFTELHLSNVELWANYVVVSNEERVKMGKCPRDMVIEQVQRHSGRPFRPALVGSQFESYDIRMSHAIKALYWNVANITRVGNGALPNAIEWSNYTASGITSSIGPNLDPNGLDGSDPVATSSLLYENTYRLHEMGSDYFSLVNPFYHFTSIPEDTGYHVYSYAIHPESQDPSGSTNYGKLTNVSLQLTPSADAIAAASYVPTPPDPFKPQVFSVQIRGLNFNIVRVSGGALGLPIL